MKIRERIKAFRADLKALFQYSVYDVAQFNGLAIEPRPCMPAKYDGHLDPHDNPRFIAVNLNLSEREQAYIIARELGRMLHRQRENLFLLNRPWKRALLAGAPLEIQLQYEYLDVEFRTSFVMHRCLNRGDYFDFPKHHPKRFLCQRAGKTGQG